MQWVLQWVYTNFDLHSYDKYINFEFLTDARMLCKNFRQMLQYFHTKDSIGEKSERKNNIKQGHWFNTSEIWILLSVKTSCSKNYFTVRLNHTPKIDVFDCTSNWHCEKRLRDSAASTLWAIFFKKQLYTSDHKIFGQPIFKSAFWYWSIMQLNCKSSVKPVMTQIS